jgi:hypothetical protein
VLLVCQERHPARYPWIDAHGTVDRDGVSALEPNTNASDAPGRCVLLRPEIGATLPVFVFDHYEGFADVRPFVDLADVELRHLRTMAAIAEEGTFGRAAARLGYTQSSVSQQIAALERALGGTVFDRPGGPR